MAPVSNLDDTPGGPMGSPQPPSRWLWWAIALAGVVVTIAEIVYSGFVHPLSVVLIGMTAFGFTVLARLLFQRRQLLLAWADSEPRGDGVSIEPGGEG